MSAIFGIWGLDGQPVSSDLAAMAGSLRHRGPDRSRIWNRTSVGLGHQMLMTTADGKRDGLPLVADAGDLVLTADARLDNRRSLLADLGFGTADDAAIDDADLILAGYRRWAERLPEHLIGDFAFALWDGVRQTLFCARDAIGIRPFYYCHQPRRLFLFASEIPGVLASPAVPLRINESKVADHLTQAFNDTHSTFYEDVLRLPPAHSLTVTPDAIRMRRYWSLDSSKVVRLATDEEYAEGFRELFVDAVRCRTRSVVSVGSTLSGGLDSSSIACAANQLLPPGQKPLRTFSAIFPGLSERELRRIDERTYVDAVLKWAPFDPTYVHADESSPLREWSSMSEHFGDACLAPNLYIHWGLYKAAAARGVRVLLDGLDGDTTVSHGLDHLSDLARTGRWVRFWGEAKALSHNNPYAYPLRGVVRELGLKPLIPAAVIRGWRAIRSQGGGRRDDRPVVSDSLIERSKRAAMEAPIDGRLSTARASHWRALTSPLIPYAMEFADAASSTFNVEVRYPFFDRRLIEFCFALPPEQKLRNGWTRLVMRRAVKGIVPPEIQWRTTKADLAPNFDRGLFDRDREMIRAVVFSPSDRLRGYVDIEAVKETFARWSAQPGRHQRDGLTLFGVTTLSLWLDRVSDARATRAASSPTNVCLQVD